MKTRIAICSAVVSMLITLQVFAQTAPTVEWEKTTGGSMDEDFGFLPSRNVIQTSSGGYLIGGASKSNISGEKSEDSKGDFDYWVVLFDASGSIVWDRTYGGSDADFLNALLETQDGGFLLGGSSYSGASGDKTDGNFGDCLSCGGPSDFWVVKITSDGDIEWEESYGGTGSDRLNVMRQTYEGGYLLAGSTYTTGIVSGTKTVTGNGGHDYYLVKIDSDGTMLWDHSYGTSAHDQETDLIITEEGNLCLGGQSEGGISGDRTQGSQGSADFWVLLLDDTGSKISDFCFGGSGVDQLKAIVQADEGGYLFGGYTQSIMSGDVSQNQVCSGAIDDTDFWIVRTDISGGILWDGRYGTTAQDKLLQIVKSNGGYVLGGQSGVDASNFCDVSGQLGGWGAWLLKVDDSGVKQWDKSLGGNITETLTSFERSNDGGFIAVMYSNSPISGTKTESSRGGFDLYTVKLSCESLTVWYEDGDGDGFGNTAVSDTSCAPPHESGWVDNNLDCNDTLWTYQDLDNDGYGFYDNDVSAPVLQVGCGVSNHDDCNDNEVEYEDADGDGYGNSTIVACGVSDNTDCNDANTAIHPGAMEVCNGVDDDCDGTADDITATVTPSGSDTACNSLILTANSVAGASYQWVKGTKNIAGATSITYTAKKSANYKVKLTGFSCNATSAATNVTINPNPTATITQSPCSSGAVLLTCTATPSTGITFQWQKGTIPIPGATNSMYSATANGNYKCRVTVTATGCNKLSSGSSVTITCKEGEEMVSKIADPLTVYPNPNNGIFTLEFIMASEERVLIKVFNVLGKEVFFSEEAGLIGVFTKQIDLSELSSGPCFLQITQGEKNEIRKLLIEK